MEDRTEIARKNFMPAERARHIAEELDKGNYAFVFSINFFPQVSDVCNIYKIPYMSLVVDSPLMELYSESIRNEYNRLFLFDRALYREFAPYNPNRIFHIPLATNVASWDKVIKSAPTDAFRSEISFVGSLYTEKCPYDNIHFTDEYCKGFLEGLIEAQLKVYGYFFIEDLITDDIVERVKKDYPNFHRFMPGDRADDRAALAQLYLGNKITCVERLRLFAQISEHFNVDIYTGSDTSSMPHIHNRGLCRTLTEMPIVFNHSKINLNISSKAIREGLPLRMFDIMGCGGFMISNYQSEITDYFNIGEHLVVYESFEDLEDKLNYYLEHDSERMEIARNGYEEVKANHNYNVRVGQMITMAFGDR